MKRRLLRCLNRIKQPMSNEKGEGSMFWLMFFLLIFCILAYCSVDLYGYYSQRQKLVIGTNELIEVIKAENGYDATNRRQFDDLIQSQGLDPAKVTIKKATPKQVQRGNTVSLVVQMDYETIGLKPLGKELTLPITVTVNGLAHTFYR
ncbi:hypothetical protein J1TS5_04040 [Paenibacillus macerans]|uniref:DUF4320 family protein n=1 Tax=Paenibacillus macerans TaxID=44252 RepID=UPI001B14A308|nr:DUF4320 family protein [Paenibacillus macerans]GIP08234.1 hypothetical protein J1TS5_04040 [Paenibacillus macerans]